MRTDAKRLDPKGKSPVRRMRPASYPVGIAAELHRHKRELYTKWFAYGIASFLLAYFGWQLLIR